MDPIEHGHSSSIQKPKFHKINLNAVLIYCSTTYLPTTTFPGAFVIRVAVWTVGSLPRVRAGAGDDVGQRGAAAAALAAASLAAAAWEIRNIMMMRF